MGVCDFYWTNSAGIVCVDIARLNITSSEKHPGLPRPKRSGKSSGPCAVDHLVFGQFVVRLFNFG